MASALIVRKICGTRNLFNVNLNHKIWCLGNANLHNFKSPKVPPVLKNKLTFLLPRRNFYRFFKRPTKDQLKIKDNIPDEYKLIYRNKADRYLFLAQLFTTVSAFFVICMAIIKHDFSNMEMDYSNWNKPVKKAENEVYVYIASFTFLVVILQVMISRLPIRIYNLPQQKKYIFVFYGNYPFMQRKLMCKVGEVVHLPESGISPWKQERYLVKNEHKLILVDEYFRRSADLYIMLGVQRDPDVEE